MSPSIETLRNWGAIVTAVVVVLGFLLKFNTRLTSVEEKCSSMKDQLQEQSKAIAAVQATVQHLSSSVAELKGFLLALGQSRSK